MRTTRLFISAGVLLLFLAARDFRAPGAEAAPDPREEAQAYYEQGKDAEAMAVLADAARKNPKDRIIAAMLYAAVRDHVWHQLQVAPVAQTGAITALAFSPDGKTLASGSTPGEVLLIPVAAPPEGGAPVHLPKMAGGEIIGLGFSKDSRRLAVAVKSAPLRLWGLPEGKLLFAAPAPATEVTTFDSCDRTNLAATGTAGGAIQVVDMAAAKATWDFTVPGKTTALAFSHSGARLGAAGSDFQAHVWDAQTGAAHGAGVAHKGTIRAVDFSYDDRYVFSAGDDSMVWLSNPDDGIAVMPAMNCEAAVKKALVSPDGSTISTLLADGSVLFWDTFTAKQLQIILREDGAINDLLWSRSGLRATTVCADGHATIWNLREGIPHGEPMPHGSPVLISATSPDTRLLATGTEDGKVRIWRTDGGVPMPTVRSHAARARTAFYSEDGKHLVTTSEDHTALHWISGQVRPFGPALKHRGAVTCAVFDEKVTRILTCDDTGVAQLWDAATGRPEGGAFIHSGPVNWADFEPGGKRCVTASRTAAFIWNVEGPRKAVATLQPPGMPGEIRCARFSPNGKWLATASTNGTVSIWDTATWKPVGERIERGFPVNCVRFSPDSSRLVVAGDDAQAAVYDCATWKITGVPVQAAGPVFSAAFTNDGQFITIAALLLNNLQFYEVATGRALGTGIEVGAQPTCVDHHQQDRVVILACDDGTVRALETPFVDEDVPPWFPGLEESRLGLRRTGPDEFQRSEKSAAEIKALVPPEVADAKTDFPRLVRWKFTTGNQRNGQPRFTSTIAANIEQRVDERSVDALFECYEALSSDPLVLAALSLYLPNPRQGEFIADLVLSLPESDPIARCFAAGTLVNAGRSTEAEAIAKRALAEAPDDLRVLTRVAKLEARFGKVAEAVALFEKALKLQPENAETRRAYAWMLYNAHQPAEAAAQFHLAEDCAGEMVEDLIAGICLCAAAQENESEAKAGFDRLVALDPAWKEAAHLTALKGWTQEEVGALETVRAKAFPAP